MKSHRESAPSQKNNQKKPELNYKDYLMDLGNLDLSDIVGQDEAIKELRLLVESIRYKHVYTSWTVPSPKGIMLVGGTGLGKTASIRALAKELKEDVILMELRYLDIASRWIDMPIEQLRAFFELAEEKSEEKHVLLFIDELESMIPDRNSQLHETSMKRVDVFLEWMDGGFSNLNNITVLGATNFEEGVDKAAKRAGRFDKIVQYKDLTADAIRTGLKTHFTKRNLSLEQVGDIDWKEVGSILKDGMLNGADLPEIVNRLINTKVSIHIQNLKNNTDFDVVSRNEQDIYVSKIEYYPDKIVTDDVIKTINDYIVNRKIKTDKIFGFMSTQET